MKDIKDALLFSDAWTSEHEEALRQALEADPELAAAVTRWRRVRAAVRQHLAARVPDHHLLIVYALEAGQRTDALTAAEREVLTTARPDLEAALAAHPALQDIVCDIQDAAADFDAIWDAQKLPVEEVSTRAADRPARRSAAARTPALRWAARAGIGIAVAVFVGLAALLLQRDRNQVTLDVAAGEVQTVTLADGSTVRLLGGSSLTYADPEKTTAFDRHVRLTGHAFFGVVEGEEGFTVETPNALATVLGTSFGVAAGDDLTEVTLVTGSVALAPKAAQHQAVRLEPGQRSHVAAGALPSTPVEVDLTEALRWTEQFVFQDTPLAVAVARLSEHYGRSVHLDETLAMEPVSGRFTEEDYTLKEILDILALSLQAEVHTQDDGSYRVEAAG